MPASAKTKQPKTTNPADLRVAAEVAGEEILLAVVRRSDEWPTAAEWLTFDGLGWDKDEVRRGVHRTRRRMQCQETAETAADRADAKTHLAAAREKLAKDAPALESKIRELQQTLADLNFVVRKREGIVREKTEAVSAVKKLLPKYIQRTVSRQIHAIKVAYRTDSGYVEVNRRMSWLRGFTTYELILKRGPTPTGPTSAEWTEAKNVRKYLEEKGITEGAWPSHREKLLAELAKLEAEQAKRENDFAAAVRAAEDEAILPFVG